MEGILGSTQKDAPKRDKSYLALWVVVGFRRVCVRFPCVVGRVAALALVFSSCSVVGSFRLAVVLGLVFPARFLPCL